MTDYGFIDDIDPDYDDERKIDVVCIGCEIRLTDEYQLGLWPFHFQRTVLIAPRLGRFLCGLANFVDDFFVGPGWLAPIVEVRFEYIYCIALVERITTDHGYRSKPRCIVPALASDTGFELCDMGGSFLHPLAVGG